LTQQRQPAEAVERFWQVVLVSALGDTLDRVSLSAARKVFVDGFLAARGAGDIIVPRVSLSELYDQQLAGWLREQGVEIRTGTVVEEVGDKWVRLAGGEAIEGEFVIVAAPWRRVRDLIAEDLRPRLPELDRLGAIQPSPITAVHLWFDRPITALPHAVIVGQLSQWVFGRPREAGTAGGSHYYQVVISGSHELRGRSKESVLDEVLGDLATVWPRSRQAVLLRSRIVTEQEAVFSMRPGIDDLRPPQQTAVPGLVLAGDWTATGWPATMEGAVRSGYLAAEAILAQRGRPQRVLTDDLPRGWLARRVIR
jgi:squalene-associated FAD-dependent desaturase